MLSFNEVIEKLNVRENIIDFGVFAQLHEAFNTLKPTPVKFGQDENVFGDPDDDFSDKKFGKIGDNVYRTVFVLDDVFVQLMIDRNTNEVSFATSKSSDVTSFSFDKGDTLSVDLKALFSHILYIVPYMVKQFNLKKIMFASKPHTKQIYNYLFDKSFIDAELKKLGIVKDRIEKDGSTTKYYFSVV